MQQYKHNTTNRKKGGKEKEKSEIMQVLEFGIEFDFEFVLKKCKKYIYISITV